MKDTLKPGMEHEFSFKINETKLVPALYPEAEEFRIMPEVFATGYMVGLIEWACIRALKPHLDWPREQSVGIHVNVSHVAATPPGLEVRVKTRLVEKDGRRLVFEVEAHDGVDLISKGRHERFVIDKARFDQRLEEKIRAGKG